ncbi:hypothetical protein AAVH_03554 [Aphelenchoides avenae]|nr:hypothetical protein AAVH_03552 [Aphelenchus avenae]KAH7729177.1 hypothetical protein AAVH_03554 [Aphelenchus avenae]
MPTVRGPQRNPGHRIFFDAKDCERQCEVQCQPMLTQNDTEFYVCRKFKPIDEGFFSDVNPLWLIALAIVALLGLYCGCNLVYWLVLRLRKRENTGKRSEETPSNDVKRASRRAIDTSESTVGDERKHLQGKRNDTGTIEVQMASASGKNLVAT